MSAPALRPSLEEAYELQAAGATVIPLVETRITDTETPVSAFLKLRGNGPAFLLESAEQGRLGRYSFIGFDPTVELRWSSGTLSERSPGELSETESDDPYGAVSALMARFDQAPVEGLPPFSGGAVGFFGYDLVRTVETTLGPPNPDPVGLPDLALIVPAVIVAFDHERQEVSVIAHAHLDSGTPLEQAYAAAAQRIGQAREALAGPLPQAAGGPADPGFDPLERFSSNRTRDEFEATVARVIEYIRAGDAFQVVPSQRFSAEVDLDPFAVYRGLRAINPSPYMYYLDFGDFQIAGASPEPLLTVHGDRVETRPIAGTYPRGATPEEDREAGERLLGDPKERAEHLMLVDLGRNDLGRVCEYGSVAVDELMVLETYSHVLHIVSAVSGRLRPGVDAVGALRSVLPAGTLSGAPKVRAMEIIDELEPHKRGSYGGAVGYVGFDGDLDTAIHIRTVVAKDGYLHVQAGGGTVADAVPEREWIESVDKAKAVFRAIELAARGEVG